MIPRYFLATESSMILVVCHPLILVLIFIKDFDKPQFSNGVNKRDQLHTKFFHPN